MLMIQKLMNKNRLFASRIKALLVSATGINCSVKASNANGIAGFKIWFDEFSSKTGLIFYLTAEGLHRHKLQVFFGEMASPLLHQIKQADTNQILRASDFITLIKRYITSESINAISEAKIRQINLDSCLYECEKANVSDHLSIAAFEESSSLILAPVISAMAELIGYDENNTHTSEGDQEGAISVSLVKRRERSLRNRLMCLRIHGDSCWVCNMDPKSIYGDINSIIEVHHIHPLGNLEEEMIFNPKTDLIPLCPNCHRAIHTKKPVPWTPEELKAKLRIKDGK
jgi:5-methylcytosine-specific restriction protein A